jgi:SAM-dependent methyltransferase
VSLVVNEEQARLWNGPSGRAWVEAQELIDRLFQPLEELLVEAVLATSGRSVLDVGCGTGGTTLAVGRRLGAGGRAVGVDVSAPMIAAARARAEREGAPVTFLEADAQTHPFAAQSFDVITSRFGVMFFADPGRAFANLRRATTQGGALRCLAFRSAEENPFMTTAERAAAPLLPDLPARRPDGPGQFSFADPARVRGILEEGGWAEIDLQPVDVPCTMPERDLVHYLSHLGPVGRALEGADEPTRVRVMAAVRPAFDRFVHGAEVGFTAACWMLGARAR